MTDGSLAIRIARFIDRCAHGARYDAERDALIAELSQLQASRIEPYRRYLAGESRRPRGFALPALPTDVFRFARVASHPPDMDVRRFRTSGTTGRARGEHALCDLSLYDRAARNAASHALFPEAARQRLCILAPSEQEAPDSSLSYMLSRFIDWFGTEHSTYAWRDGGLRMKLLTDTLRAAEARREPIALLGTSFAFVHAEDMLGTQRFQLPPGSRIMQTGGFKGRSRSIEPETMLALLHARYGVPLDHIVQEYGMTELSSQMYESVLLDPSHASDRRLWIPGWVRAEPVDPVTLEPVDGGATGLLRIDDLANVGSVCSVQTSDLAQRCELGEPGQLGALGALGTLGQVGQLGPPGQPDHPHGERDQPDPRGLSGRSDADRRSAQRAQTGIRLLGRAPGAVARGCSLAVEEWLDSRTHAGA